MRISDWSSDVCSSDLSSSATTAPGEGHTYAGKQAYAEARPLDVAEIPRLLDDYARATRNALAAGFDGVQLHAANGYLIDQFLRDGANFRTDRYGGSPENRFRLLLEVVERSEEHTSELQSLMRISYAVFRLQ